MNFLGCLLMAAITFPVSYYVARGCLRGILRVFRLEQELFREPAVRRVL